MQNYHLTLEDDYLTFFWRGAAICIWVLCISSCRIYIVDAKLSPAPLFQGGAARRRKELKFSWDDRVKHEDWGIQKVIIIDCDDGDGDGDDG